MKVSIIIPVYNVALYIERCLLSVYNQTYKNIEVIIVDDCGKDNSMALAKEISEPYHDQFDITFLRHEKNRGLSAGRNTGSDVATGEYLYFLDSDDSITPDCIELMVAAVADYKYDFVIGDHYIIGSGIGGTRLRLEGGAITDNSTIQQTYYKYLWNMNAWNKLVNREFMLANNLYFKEGLIHEDDLWSFYLSNAATSMLVLKSKIYEHYIRENSIMTSLQFDTTFKHRSVIIDCMNEYILSHIDTVDSSVYSYIEVRKRALFHIGYNANIGWRRLYGIYGYIREVPIVNSSHLSRATDRIWLFNRKLPKSIGFAYYLGVFLLEQIYRKLFCKNS